MRAIGLQAITLKGAALNTSKVRPLVEVLGESGGVGTKDIYCSAKGFRSIYNIFFPLFGFYWALTHYRPVSVDRHVYIYIYIFIFIDVHIYIYTHTHMNIYIYAYTHIDVIHIYIYYTCACLHLHPLNFDIYHHGTREEKPKAAPWISRRTPVPDATLKPKPEPLDWTLECKSS